MTEPFSPTSRTKVQRLPDRGRYDRETVYRILQARHPKLRYLAGRDAKLVLACRRYIPGSIFENIYWAILRKMVTRPRHAVDGLSQDIPGSVESGRTHSQ